MASLNYNMLSLSESAKQSGEVLMFLDAYVRVSGEDLRGWRSGETYYH